MIFSDNFKLRVYIPTIRSRILVSIVGLLTLNYFMSNDVIAAAVTVVAILVIVSGRKENVLPTYIFLSFFSMLFQYQGINLFAFIGVAVSIRMLMGDMRKNLTMFLLHIIYVISHSISLQGGISFGFLIPSILAISMYSCCHLYDSTQYEECINSFISGLILSTLIGLLRALSISRMNEIYADDRVFLGSSEGFFRYAGLAYDCNFYALLVIIGLTILLFSTNNVTNKNKQRYLSFVFLLVFGILTFSKSFYISCIIVIIIWIMKSGLSRMIQILATAVGGLLAFVVFSDLFTEIIREIITRFSLGTDINSFTTGRVQIWGYYLQRYVSSIRSIWFGNGFGDHGYWKAAHNLYLEVLFDYGLVGMLCDVIFVLICKKIFFRRIQIVNSLCGRIGTILFWVYQMFLSSYTFHSLTVCILMTFILRSLDERTISEDCS